MRFFLAFAIIALYASNVQGEDIPKSAFCMNAVAPTQPKIQTPVVRQEWRQVQVCSGNYCRLEWRLMPVNQSYVTTAPIQVYSSGR